MIKNGCNRFKFFRHNKGDSHGRVSFFGYWFVVVTIIIAKKDSSRHFLGLLQHVGVETRLDDIDTRSVGCEDGRY